MGVEGKDRAKVLEAGAASLSNQLGQAVLKLRKGYGLSLADLSQHSGVAKSIISQIERNETNPTLATIWRLAHALDVSIESMLRGADEGPVHRTSRPWNDTDLCLRRRTMPSCRDRMAENRRLAAMVRFSGRSGRSSGIGRSSARIGRVPVGFGWRARGRRGRDDGDCLRRRDAALPMRYASSHPQLEREAGPRHDGLHSQGRHDGLRANRFFGWIRSPTAKPERSCGINALCAMSSRPRSGEANRDCHLRGELRGVRRRRFRLPLCPLPSPASRIGALNR